MPVHSCSPSTNLSNYESISPPSKTRTFPYESAACTTPCRRRRLTLPSSGHAPGYRVMPLMSNVCAVHGTNPVGCKSRHQVHAEPKVSQRASASSRGEVRRKPKAKSRGDEQKSDMRRDAPGTSGHVTAKSSICSDGTATGRGAFCKSGVYAKKDPCLTAGDLHGAGCQQWHPAGRRVTGAEYCGEVSTGRTRPGSPGQRLERCKLAALA